MKILRLLITLFFMIGIIRYATKPLHLYSQPCLTNTTNSYGQSLFEIHCTKCHGLDGTRGRFGAKNLQKSTLTDDQYFTIIQKGKGIMPAWEKKLSALQITAIIHYIKQLKK